MVRIDFQTYMQRRYFEQMVDAANRRLAGMSGHQFLLECRELENLGRQGEAGLDLDVYSLVNDSVRDVKTLSGGESFMAALALALGMADVIQQEAGKPMWTPSLSTKVSEAWMKMPGIRPYEF